jgi:hypothetical protein
MTPQDERLIIFRVSQGEAHFWDWESNLSPKDIIKFG